MDTYGSPRHIFNMKRFIYLANIRELNSCSDRTDQFLLIKKFEWDIWGFSSISSYPHIKIDLAFKGLFHPTILLV